jgi:hypothetical protein
VARITVSSRQDRLGSSLAARRFKKLNHFFTIGGFQVDSLGL